MRRRMVMTFAASLALAAAVLLAEVRPTEALSATIVKGKSDCASIELGITLVYNQDDTGGSDLRDHFKLEIYDKDLGHLIAQIKESILQEQSPFYWQTGRIPGATYQGDYRIEMWDTNDKGEKLRRIDQAYLQCSTQNMWRDFPVETTPRYEDYPAITCYSRIPIWTTNGAPEKGAVIINYTFGTERTDQEWQITTLTVNPGDTLDNTEVSVPCGTYIRIYYQPDSTKLLYYMPSQYWPHNLYGSLNDANSLGPIYNTFFPLNGPLRGNATYTPTATSATWTPTPSGTPPTATPTP